MELHQLRYFCAVARAGNFTRAAEQEHVSQPSLSQQVLKLEDELGTRLFDRLGRSIRLTASGEAFLPKAEAVLRQLSQAKLEIREMSGVEKGTVTVGTIPTIAPYFLPARLSSFARQHPQIQVSVVEEITPVLLEKLQEGRIDLALLALPVVGDHFVSQELLREPLYLVVPQTHCLAGQTRVHLNQIEDESFLLLKEGHCFRENTLAACGRARLRPNVVFESGQFATLLAMVAAGAGISVVPAMAVEPRAGCCFIPLADDASHRRVGIVRLKRHFRSRAEIAFIDHLRRGVAQPVRVAG